MRESVLFDNKEWSNYARRENRERQRERGRGRGRERKHSPALVALPKSAALITLNWPAPNNVTTVKCNIKIFRTFILGLSPLPPASCFAYHTALTRQANAKKAKNGHKMKFACGPHSNNNNNNSTSQRKGNNFHKAKHLLYLPNGVWKQAQKLVGIMREPCALFSIMQIQIQPHIHRYRYIYM